MDLNELQHKVGMWAEKNFGDQAPYRPLLGVAEEVGELAHAQLKKEQGIRGTPEEHLAKLKDAVGDIMIYLADFCHRSGINLNDCVKASWAEVSKRDWVRFPKNGTSE